jgi:hypothetical protein
MGIHNSNLGQKVIGFPKWYYNTIILKPYKAIKEFLSYEYTP